MAKTNHSYNLLGLLFFLVGVWTFSMLLHLGLPPVTALTSMTSTDQTPTSTIQVYCTPPLCQPGEVLYCPDYCPGGCGVRCATPTSTPTNTPTSTATQLPSDQWRVDYYNGRNFDSYTSTDYEPDLFISHNWGGGSPGHGVGADNFSIRYQRRVHFDSSCEWEFTIGADDGYRLYIDGNVIAERWSEGYLGGKATVFLTAGYHDVKLEYFEATGGARVSLSWQCQNPITPTPTPPLTSTAIVQVLPTLISANVGRAITITIAISNVNNLGAFEFTLAYSPSLVTVQNITLGEFPGSSRRTFNPLGPTIDNAAGTATFGAYSLGASPPGSSGSGALAHIWLQPHAVGTAPLHLSNVQVTDVPGNIIEVTTQDATLRISACLGDFDGDGDVDIIDVQRIAYRWNTRCGDPLYDAIYDLDGDCDIDIIDVQRVANRVGTRCDLTDMPQANQLATLQAITLTVQPQSQIVSVGQTFTVGVHISNAADLGAFEFTLAYSPTVVQVVTATLGPFLGSTGRTVTPLGPVINAEAGAITYGAYSLGSTPAGPTGNGLLAILTLRALAEGKSNLVFTAAQAGDRIGNAQLVSHTGGEITVNVPLAQRTYRVGWLSHNTPNTLREGETRTGISMSIRNNGNWTWPYTGSNRVRLSYHWLDSTGKTVIWDGLRTALPYDLRPGQQVELSARCKAPSAPGTYTLVWDMVEEGITWFEWRGSPLLSLQVNVQPRTYRVTWLSFSMPVTMMPNETVTNTTITIRNDSNWTWPYTGTNRVRLSYHWLDSTGKTVSWDGLRTALPYDLRPGQQIELSARCKAPNTPGIYTLVWDMVEEGITWFEWRGSPILSVRIDVTRAQGSAQYKRQDRDIQ
ncbi:MAG: hypothetical protein H5T68_09415 [Chloroflexi bacterium]|nr:hypothetical protein [Chloroflexota bacterium]